MKLKTTEQVHSGLHLLGSEIHVLILFICLLALQGCVLDSKIEAAHSPSTVSAGKGTTDKTSVETSFCTGHRSLSDCPYVLDKPRLSPCGQDGRIEFDTGSIRSRGVKLESLRPVIIVRGFLLYGQCLPRLGSTPQPDGVG